MTFVFDGECPGVASPVQEEPRKPIRGANVFKLPLAPEVFDRVTNSQLISDCERWMSQQLSRPELIGGTNELDEMCIAAERLQKAGETRVADSKRKFVNHYELAIHLLGASTISDGPVSDSGLGRVDLLFGLLARLGIDTPEQLAPYLEALHGNLELRPLAEQVIDALLAENDSRYGIYRSVRAEAHRPIVEQDFEDQDIYRQVGIFLTNWIELERLVRKLASYEGQSGLVMPPSRQLQHLQLLDPDMRREIDFLRRMRNNVVHGIELPAADDLAEAAQRLKSIATEIRRRGSTES